MAEPAAPDLTGCAILESRAGRDLIVIPELIGHRNHLIHSRRGTRQALPT